MSETPRVTRSWPWGAAKYTTSYKKPTNWGFFSVLDLAPMFFAMLLYKSPAFGPLFGVAFLWCLGRLVHRRSVRSHWCADHGHDPYRPVPEVAQYRCWYCDTDLADGEVVGQAERGAIPRPQSYYSDRR